MCRRRFKCISMGQPYSHTYRSKYVPQRVLLPYCYSCTAGGLCYPTFPENTFFPENSTTIPENTIIPDKIRRGVLRHCRKVIHIPEKHGLVNFSTTLPENTYPREVNESGRSLGVKIGKRGFSLLLFCAFLSKNFNSLRV